MSETQNHDHELEAYRAAVEAANTAEQQANTAHSLAVAAVHAANARQAEAQRAITAGKSGVTAADLTTSQAEVQAAALRLTGAQQESVRAQAEALQARTALFIAEVATGQHGLAASWNEADQRLVSAVADAVEAWRTETAAQAAAFDHAVSQLAAVDHVVTSGGRAPLGNSAAPIVYARDESRLTVAGQTYSRRHPSNWTYLERLAVQGVGAAKIEAMRPLEQARLAALQAEAEERELLRQISMDSVRF